MNCREGVADRSLHSRKEGDLYYFDCLINLEYLPKILVIFRGLRYIRIVEVLGLSIS